MNEKANLDEWDLHELLAAVKACGGQRAFSRKYNVARTTLQDKLYKLRSDPFQHRPRPEAVAMGHGSGRRRFILTSAQDGTQVHESFLTNLEAYADWLEGDAPCEIVVAGYTYNKSLFEDHTKDKAPRFHQRVQPYLRNERMRLCEGLDFCGEMNTLPTAPTPLAGFETYTRHRWGVFPHAKVQLVSVPTQKHLPTKINMTTGTCTLSNYVPKRAGIKASFHHAIAAVIVEIDADEEFFCRHLIADEDDGSFYDLDRFVKDGVVTTEHRIDVLTPGDIHVAQIDPQTAAATFGFWPTGNFDEKQGYVWEGGDPRGTILGDLRPRHVYAHDVTDFHNRNSHEIRDPVARYKRWVEGEESVKEELRQDAMFLTHLSTLIDGQLHAVNSNHHDQLERWIKTTDWREDPPNAAFYLDTAKALIEAMDRRDKAFDLYAHVMKNAFDEWKCENVEFLKLDGDSVVNDVQHANHGHHGANGTRGSIRSFVRGGSKTTSGHTHTAAILDGAYVSGTTSKLDLGYNVGMSSWSNSHVIQYDSGHRTILTLKAGRWKI